MRGWILAACAAVLLGCGARASSRDEVVLWHTYAEKEKAALESLVSDWNGRGESPAIRLVGVPYDAFADKITAAIPNGNGPDLFVFPGHDRIGDWAEAGILEPVEFFVDESVADRFDARALSAMAWRESLWGLPLAVKSLALFYRTDLVKTPPATTDELLALGRTLTDPAAGRYGLAYENTKLYGHAAWLFGFGGDVFDTAGVPRLASPEAVRALEFARTLGGPGGIVPPETSSQLVATLFTEGRAAMVLSGPWFVGGLPEGTPYAVAPLPTMSATGRPAAPLLGAEAVMMSARARDKRAVFRVMDFLAGDDSARRRAGTARQVVPNRRVYEDPVIGEDPVLSAFRAQAERAHPMSSSPEMRLVWTPYDTALQKVLAQGVEPARALEDAEREVHGYAEGRP